MEHRSYILEGVVFSLTEELTWFSDKPANPDKPASPGKPAPRSKKTAPSSSGVAAHENNNPPPPRKGRGSLWLRRLTIAAVAALATGIGTGMSGKLYDEGKSIVV